MGNQKDTNSKIQNETAIERFGLRLAAWSEKWFPDAWVFALLGIVFVFVFGMLIGESPSSLAIAGGKQFWVLIPFTMQMAMIIIGGYVVASTPAVYWIIREVATIPSNGKTAVAWVALFSMLTSLISWGSASFSAVFWSGRCRGASRTWTSGRPARRAIWGLARYGHWGFPHRLR